MPKLSVAVRNQKRKKLVEKYAERWMKFKKEGNYEALDKLPKNALPVRLMNRCWRCERARGFFREFGLCRICFKEMATQGEIPGIRKASW
ncbi:MAG: 30S ribosomal protein S14 [Bacteroidota bacterium]